MKANEAKELAENRVDENLKKAGKKLDKKYQKIMKKIDRTARKGETYTSVMFFCNQENLMILIHAKLKREGYYVKVINNHPVRELYIQWW